MFYYQRYPGTLCWLIVNYSYICYVYIAYKHDFDVVLYASSDFSHNMFHYLLSMFG